MKKVLCIALCIFALISHNVNAQTLSANDVYIRIDGNSQYLGRLGIKLKDAQDCVAIGFRISFPEEINSGGSMSTPIGFKHDIYDHNDKFLFVSDDNDTFESDIELLDLSPQAVSFDAFGTYECLISDIELATKDFQLIQLPDVSFTVLIDNQNSIGVIDEELNGDEQIYSVSGIIQDELMEGVNIIRKADGTTMKVLK